jgi:hypothetical protein
MPDLGKMLADDKNSVESLRRSTVDKNFFTSIFSVGEAGVQVVNQPLKISFETYGDAWIVGSSTNGLVGVNTGTQGGGQQVVGGGGRVEAVRAVVNPSNVFVDFFRFTDFVDTVNTTATVSTSSCDVSFANAEIVQSLDVAKRSANFVSATLTVDDSTNLTAQMSCNAGVDWENVTIGSLHTFVKLGASIRYRLTASGVAGVSWVRVSYS